METGLAPRLGRLRAEWIPAYAGMTVIIGGAARGEGVGSVFADGWSPVGSRFRGNDVATGDPWRRACAPSVALVRRMDSCLRRNDGKGGGAIAGRSTLDEGCRLHSVRLWVHARLRLPPDLPSVTLPHERELDAALLRLPPDLPSVTLARAAVRADLQLRLPPDLPSVTLQYDMVRMARELRLPPDLPSVTLAFAGVALRGKLRLPPDLPSVTLLQQAA